ncbi:hypothetical protein J8Z24_11915 [Pseudoalteromonas sp. SCSIO 43201]|uniref:hypothetical protein n=1 Tax=Pseudoalteromonas sp. SCSIO 43201 TaxID=2822842 RepID=UPI002076178E|nr:hypothetical protein [Pseudoalteromonas sp. SCSIO 43201]USD27656.1 hypothetical protein J8Z24_11915 [Pseudoalteromonas sp. SCSIO 43201]
MSPEEIQSVLNFLLRYGFEGVIAGLVVFLLVKYFLPGYLSQKGKNLATKEDISEITKEIEEVKSTYSQIMETFKAQHQLRLAAVEKRLQAHQEAFCLWRKINGALGTEHLPGIIRECDEWWGNNSLYLEAEPRRAFLEAWVSAKDLKWYQENSEASLVSKCYQQINYAGEAITKAVELPRLNELIDTKEPNKSMQPTAKASAD